MRFENYIFEAAKDASKTTNLQEDLHSVGFAIGQVINKDITNKDILDETLFQDAFDRFCDIGSSDDKVYDFFLRHEDWTNSVVNAVNAIRNSKWYKKKNYTFYRGRGFMSLVYDEFNRLKKMEGIKLSNDKWNPGDVWASTVRVIPNFNSLFEFNEYIHNSLIKGIILPISLKKTGKSAKIILVSSKEPTPIIKYSHIQKPKQTIFPTGITIMTDKKGLGINFRSFRISKQADITGEIVQKGGSARYGKVASSVKKDIISKYKIPQMNKSKIQKFVKNNIEDLKEIVTNLWKDCGYNFNKKQIDDGWSKRKNKIQDDVGYWQSIIHALEIGSFLNMNKSVSNDIMKIFFISGSSISDISSDHIKVY